MNTKSLLAGIAAGIVIGLSMPAMAAETSAAEETAAAETLAAETMPAETAAVLPLETTAAVQQIPSVYTTPDGVLSIQVPSTDWVVDNDPLRWFAVTNGRDSVTVDHYAAGERTLASMVTESTYAYGTMYQTILSTENEVFVIKGFAVKRENLGTLMQIIGSIKILKFDTITASQQTLPLQPGAGSAFQPTTAAADASLAESLAAGQIPGEVRSFNATYYVTASALNVRSGAGPDAPVLGRLSWGDTVTVLGQVLQNGQDSGWLQISYNGVPAYVAGSYLSSQRPVETEAPATRAARNDDDDEDEIVYEEEDDDNGNGGSSSDNNSNADFIEQEGGDNGEIFLE